jgi:hypothetical protein
MRRTRDVAEVEAFFAAGPMVEHEGRASEPRVA